MPFSVNCGLCNKKFRTGNSLRKHFQLNHQGNILGRARFEDDSGIHADEPKGVALALEDREEYFKWLGVLVERINYSLVPDHPGKPLAVLFTKLQCFGLS